MANQAKNQTRGESIPGIERATNRSWEDWLSYFESHDAAKLPHPEIAKLARAAVPDTVKNPDWWAQGIAIAFEQHAGLRVPGQSSTGTYRVSASRALDVDRDDAIEAWVASHGEAEDHRGHAVTGARRSRTDKRSFFRFSLEGAGKVEVSATPNAKDPSRSTLGVSHDNLASDDDIEPWRAHWKALLAAI